MAESLEARLRDALAPNLLLVRELGAGGMARVFLAREPALKRLVAVKVLSGDLATTDAGRARFEREAQAVAALSHPNIVSVHSVGALADGTPYFIMQYVDGRSMSDRVEKEGPLSIPEARRALGEVAAALAAAHKAGIIHRDVKPANVLYEDSTGRVLVSDFGIAAVGRDGAAATPVNTKLTATGSILGTPQYMSPEQLLAEPVTDKTDVYSLGLLAHELLAGTAPFKGTSPHELIAAHLRDVPAKLSVRRPGVDPELDDVVARCLEKDATRRPTADEVARRLTPGAGALLEWPPPGLEELHGRMRHISIMHFIGGAALALVLFTIIAAGPRLGSAMTSPVTLLLIILAFAALIAFGVALARTLRAATAAARALRSGYAWLTVLETMCDLRGDTANIIAGSREYAGLKPELRDSYRKGRIWSEVVLFAGGFLAPPLFIVAMILGSSGVAGRWIVWLAVLTPMAGLVAAAVFAERERRAFAAHRKRRAAVEDVKELAASWNSTFEGIRIGQLLGRGPTTAPNLGRWSVLAAAVVLALVIIFLIPLTIVGTIGPSYWSLILPKFANTKEKARVAAVARPFDLPKDSRITPLAAGKSFRALHPVRSARPSTSFREQPMDDTLPPPPWSEALAAELFPSARFASTQNLPSPLKILPMARAGLSAAERAFLERVATAPQWKHWDLLARAPTYDYTGARFQLPFGPGDDIHAFPIPGYTATKMLAYASVSRAAHQMIRGRRDSAEAALRSTIAVGFLMSDQGNTVIEQLIGIVTVAIGRQALIDYYKLIGDPRGAQLQARLDSVVAQVDALTRVEAPSFFTGVDVRDPQALRAAIALTASDRNEMRGIRMEMLVLLGMAPCTNLRELVFGLDPDLRALFDRQRAALGRFASDSAVIDLMERQTETFTITRSPLLVRASRVAGTMLGNKRLAGCVAMIDMLAT